LIDTRETLLDLPAVWNVLRIGRVKILLITLVSTFASAYYAFIHSVPKYQATSVIVLETQFQQISGMKDIISDLPLGGFSTDPILFSEREVFKSRILMREVVNELDLIANPEFKFLAGQNLKIDDPKLLNQLAIDKLLKVVEVKLIPNSFAFQISATIDDPKLAKDIADAVAQTYIQGQLDSKKEASNTAVNWLSKRVAELQVSLEVSEQRVQDFGANIALLTEEDLKAREIKLKELRARAKNMEFAQRRLYAFDQSETSDPVAALKSGPSTAAPNAMRIDLNTFTALQRGESQLSALNASIAVITDEIRGQSRDLLKLAQIKREAEASRVLYESFLSKLKEVSVQQGIQRPDSRMLSFSALPLVPISPNRFGIILVSSVLGSIFGVFFVFLQFGLRSNFQTSDELASEIGLPIIGVVPRVSKRQADFESLKNNLSQTPFHESIRAIRTKLLKDMPKKNAKVVMITSALEDEYKSFYALALAWRMHDLDRRVLVLDCDLRRGNKEAEKPSVANFLSRETSLIQTLRKQSEDGPNFLLAGQPLMNPADLLGKKEFADLLAQLRNLYDFIIVDTPPTLLFTDASVVLDQCDEYLFCIESEVTQKADVLKGLDSLKSSSARLSGLILANADMSKQQGKSLSKAQANYRVFA